MLPPSHHTFETIWGHEPVKRLVRRMLETGRLPHALLLHGPDGVGKRSLAFAMAKVILSAGLPVPASRLDADASPRFALKSPGEPDAPDGDLFSGQDDLFGGQPDLFAATDPPLPAVSSPPPAASRPSTPAPRPMPISLDPRINRLVSKSYPIDYESGTFQGCADINIIEPIKSKSILVDQVRDLQDLGWLPPVEGAYRVILILGADSITGGAANSLLKLLEEPPSFLVLILTSDHPHRMLETIRSRCASLPCHPLGRDDLKARLVQDERVDPELARVAATLSGGCPARAIEAVRGGAREKREEVFSARLDLDRRGLAALPASTGRILEKAGSLGQAALLLMAFARDRLVRQLVPARGELLVNEDLTAQIDEISAEAPALWEEGERLLDCLRLERHPLVAAPEPALETALWPE